MPKIYRAMKQDGNKPVIGQSSSALVARIPGDILPDSAGKVHPGTKGMSVSPSFKELPAERIPRRLRSLLGIRNATGNNSHSIWRMGEGPFVAEPIAARLQLRPDPVNSRHGFVEPDTVMSAEDYQSALAATQDVWSIDETGL